MLKKLKLQRWLLLVVAGLFFLNTSAFSQNRQIAGSVTSSSMYVAGATMDVNFSVTVSSPDWEWLETFTLVFPANVTINSASTLDDNDAVITGQTIVWEPNLGPPNGGGTWLSVSEPFSVNVTVGAAVSGDLNLNWTMAGDGWGNAPHTASGTTTIAELPASPGLNLETINLDLGYRPIGAWKKSGKFEVVNNPGKGAATITASEIDDVTGFLALENPTLPYVLAEGASMEIGLTSTAAATNGQSFTGTYGLVYNDGDRSLLTATYSALAYTPVAGNVWENPYTGVNINAPYGSGTNSALGLYNVYELPDAVPADGRNFVYKLVIPTDRMFHLSPQTTVGAKWALYAEGFEGVGGPDVDNSVVHGTGVLSNFPLYAGTYYLVFSTTGNDYNVYFDASIAMPLPVAAFNPAPADGAININNGMSLSWDFGAYTDQYQLVLGTTYPPSTVVVPFTSNLSETYVLTGLQPNLQYFWQVNSRNTSGTTAGTVWGFTTTIDVPTGFNASVVDLTPTVPTVAVNLSWTGDNSRAFLGYNVYRNGVKLNATLLTGTTYADLGVARNTTYTYGVSTVYDEGESAPATIAVTTKGVGIVTGTVTDELTTTPIAGATVVVSGHEGSYTLTTAANGTYSAQVYAGDYGYTVSAEGFITETISGVAVAHAATVTRNFQLLEIAYPVDFVIASELSDDQVLLEWGFDIESFVPQQYPFNTNGMSREEIAKNWQAFIAMNNLTANGNATDSRSLVEYQIYREKVYQPGTEELIGTTIQNQFVDFDWGLQDWGVYKWNVRVVYTNQLSAPVSSNTLDKDMLTTVSVAVVTNSGDSPAGTTVSFTNISEPALELDFSTVLGANGTFAWDAFRKGTYNIEVARPGYETITENNVDIFDASEFSWLLIEILAVPSDLYVTPTGLATWSAGNAAHGGFENYTTDFESDNGGWTTGAITGTSQWEWGTPAQTIINRAYSGSKAWMTGLTANYAAGSDMWIMREFDFTDAVSPMISAQLFLQIENNWDGMILESSIDGGTTWIQVVSEGLYNGLPTTFGALPNVPKWTNRLTNYQLFSGSLASLAGESSVWLRFRFKCDNSLNFEGVAIDNISVTDMPAPAKSRELLSFKVFNDGVLVAEVTEPTYQYGTNGEVLVDGQTYLAEVATVYTTGQSEKASYTWTYIACDNYAAPANFTATQVEGTVNVALAWTMPTGRAIDAVDFARLTRDGEVIAEVEGTSYLDEDLDFATYTYCITFVYESGAETCPATICETVEVVGGGMVNGNVKQAAYLGGANIEGAEVMLTNTADNTITFTFTTNAAGNYTGEVLAGTYDYTVAADGYVSATLEDVFVAQTATVTRNFELMEYPYTVGDIVATELTDNAVQVNWSGNGGGGGTTEDFFEGFEAGTLPTDWVIYNVDGDGFNWENTATTYTTFDAHTGAFCMTSASYVNGVGALTPNNWLVSPALAVTGDSELRFWVDGQDPAYAAEQYYVKVSTTGNAVADFTTTIHSAVSPATWGEVVVDLSAFAGQTIYIAFQHANVTDMYFLKLDDVTVTSTTSRAAFTASVAAGVSTAMPFKTAGMTESMIQTTAAAYAQANANRALVGYNVYRTTCATGDLQFLGFTLDMQFTDNTWGAAEAGVYKWGVVAEYDQNASEVRFSNCLDKDMVTQVSVAVTTNSLDSPVETEVSFTNTSEPDLALAYEVTLDETGVYAWDEFRKGTYDIYVEKAGFAPIALTAYVIDGPEAFAWILEELLVPVADLYVTPNGYATWRQGGIIPFENFAENFDAGIPETWTIVDGGSTTDTWYMETPAGNPQTAGASVDGTPFAYVDSDEAGSGSSMDEMLTSPAIDASNADMLYLHFDQYYNNFASTEYAKVEVFNGTEWITLLNQTSDAGSWAVADHKVIDVTEYINDAFQVRFHYFSPGWNWYWAVDNVAITQESEMDSRSFQNYKVWLDGVFVTDTENTFHQYDTETLVAGQEYFSEVAAVYTNGMSAKMSYTWTYIPCDQYAGPQQFDGEVIDETDVLLTWSDILPLELVQITQNPGAPANGYYQQYGYGYGVAYDMSAYPDALLNSIDFHHASWGTTGTWNYKIHVYNWDTKTLIGTYGPFQTTGNDLWEMGVELPNVSTGGASTVAILMEPLSNSSTDAYPDLSSDSDANPQGSIYGSLSDVNAIGSSTIGNFLMEAYIYTAYGAVKATPVTFDYVKAPVAQARIASTTAAELPVITQSVNRNSRVDDTFVGANIYRDGMMIAEMLTDTSYLDAAVEPGVYNYCITYVYESGATSCPDANCIEVSLTEDCVAPIDLTAVLAADPAKVILTWNSFAGAWMHYGDLVYVDAIGLTDFSAFTVAIQWDPADLVDYDGRAFSKMKLYYGTGSIGDISVQVWEGTTLVMEQAVTTTIVGESWNEIEFTEPVVIDATKSYRIGYTTSNYDGYPAGAQNYANDLNSDLVLLDGAWDNLSNYLPYSWMIETFIGEAPAGAFNAPVESTIISKATSANLVSSPVAVNTNRSDVGRNADRAFLGYNVYREGTQVNSELVPENTYLDIPGTPGNYCYTVTAVYSLCGESEPSNEACIDVLVGVNDQDLANNRIYPNPSNSVVNIELTSNISQVVVYNYVGQVVFEQNVTKSETIQLNVRNYESGAYLVKFLTNTGESFTKKVVVTK